MFMPDYGMVQLLHKQRVAEMNRKERSRVASFAAGNHLLESLVRRLSRRWRRSEPVDLTGYKPAHINR